MMKNKKTLIKIGAKHITDIRESKKFGSFFIEWFFYMKVLRQTKYSEEHYFALENYEKLRYNLYTIANYAGGWILRALKQRTA